MVDVNSPLLSEIEEEITQDSQNDTVRHVRTKVPEVEIHLFRQGKGPVIVFKSALGGWEQDQLEVGDILEKLGFKCLFAFNHQNRVRGVPVRFNPRNGRSILTYRDGAVVYLDGEPKALGTGFTQFAEPVFGRCINIIQTQQLAKIIVDCSGEGVQEKTLDTAFLNKKAALLKLAEGNRVPRTIVFCNKIQTCRKVENALNRFDRKGSRMQVLPFHSAMTQESRLASIKEFTCPPSNELSQFMVCTDRASRGIDFAVVDHVILFDYPRDPSEYVRRVGRTARGARGQRKAFIFVVGKQVSLARKISERNRKGHPLHDVPSAYES